MAALRSPRDVSVLVDTMFEAVLTPPERAELLVWIRRWEAENPDVDAAHRVTGWIDVAYAFQERLDRRAAADRSLAWGRHGSAVFA